MLSSLPFSYPRLSIYEEDICYSYSVSYFYCCCNKMLDSNTLKKEGFILACDLNAGDGMWPEYKATGHTLSTVKKLRDECCCSTPFLLFIKSWIPAHRVVPYSRQVFSP